MLPEVWGLQGCDDISVVDVEIERTSGGVVGEVECLQEVAGVALIDSATPYQFDLPDYPTFYKVWRRASALLPSLSRAGFGRLVLDTGFTTLPTDARDQLRAFAAEPRELRANNAEFAELRTVFDQAKALTSLGEKPLGVVSAGVGQQSGWAAAQAKLHNCLRTASIERQMARPTKPCSKMNDSQRLRAERSLMLFAPCDPVGGDTSDPASQRSRRRVDLAPGLERRVWT